jgi:hypothetical protein
VLSILKSFTLEFLNSQGQDMTLSPKNNKKRKPRIGTITIHTFKVHVDTILSAEGLALPDNDSRHDLLPEVGLTLLHSVWGGLNLKGLGRN